MKLVYCVGQLDRPGGTEKVMANKVNFFVNKLGYEVHIITVNQKDKPIFYDFDEKIIFHDISYEKKGSVLNPFVFYKNISYFKKQYNKIFNIIKPDIITVNERGYLDFVIPFINKKIPKIREFHSSKKAISIHARQMEPWIKKVKHILMYKIYYYLFNKYNALVLLTQSDKNDSKYKTKTFVIPNTHKPVVNKKAELVNKRVISVGSMNGDIKRFDLQISLWKEIVKEFPDWTLHIYGDGLKRDILNNKIKELGLVKHVFLHGNKQDLYKYYLDSSIFLFTSSGEGFGMVLVEAMSYGVPCISFDCPYGPNEIIKNNEDGFLVKNNDVNELQEKLQILMKNSELRKEFGKKAFENSKRFLPENIAPKWVNLYNKLIKDELK